jgi:hypothetical protein
MTTLNSIPGKVVMKLEDMDLDVVSYQANFSIVDCII